MLNFRWTNRMRQNFLAAYTPGITATALAEEAYYISGGREEIIPEKFFEASLIFLAEFDNEETSSV